MDKTLYSSIHESQIYHSLFQNLSCPAQKHQVLKQIDQRNNDSSQIMDWTAIMYCHCIKKFDHKDISPENNLIQ